MSWAEQPRADHPPTHDHAAAGSLGHGLGLLVLLVGELVSCAGGAWRLRRAMVAKPSHHSHEHRVLMCFLYPTQNDASDVRGVCWRRGRRMSRTCSNAARYASGTGAEGGSSSWSGSTCFPFFQNR